MILDLVLGNVDLLAVIFDLQAVNGIRLIGAAIYGRIVFFVVQILISVLVIVAFVVLLFVGHLNTEGGIVVLDRLLVIDINLLLLVLCALAGVFGSHC
ncbi:hypothetical protein D3C81_1396830 [compost metagenome]